VSGDDNKVSGVLNDVQGKDNRVDGLGNQVEGKGNFVSGVGNVVQNNLSKEEEQAFAESIQDQIMKRMQQRFRGF